MIKPHWFTPETLFDMITCPEIMTREQWCDVNRINHHEIGGDRRLAVGMLQTAWEDANTIPDTRQKLLNRRAAIDWVRGIPPGKLPMVDCCYLLGLNPAWFREGFMRRLHLHLQVRRLRLTLVHRPKFTPLHHTAQASRVVQDLRHPAGDSGGEP